MTMKRTKSINRDAFRKAFRPKSAFTAIIDSYSSLQFF